MPMLAQLCDHFEANREEVSAFSFFHLLHYLTIETVCVFNPILLHPNTGVLLRKLGALVTWPINLKLSLASFDIYSPKY